MSRAQDAMTARRQARKTMMKRIARREPMLDSETISVAFRKVSAAGDSWSQREYDTDGNLGFATFRFSEDTEVFIWVFSNGTYECAADRTYDPDILEWAACVGRAAAFVTELKLKRRPS